MLRLSIPRRTQSGLRAQTHLIRFASFGALARSRTSISAFGGPCPIRCTTGALSTVSHGTTYFAKKTPYWELFASGQNIRLGAENLLRLKIFSSKNLGLGAGSWKFPQKHPMLLVKNGVGVPRIELGLSAPKADVLPIYYTPTPFSTPRRRTTDILHPVIFQKNNWVQY